MKTWLIYKHTSLESGKSYVGLTCNSMELRWQQHCSAARTGGSLHFCRAITLYGEDNWEHEVVVDGLTSLDEAIVLEKYYIRKFDTFENGYNLTLGGEHSHVVAEVYEFYNPILGIIESMSASDLAVKYSLHQGYIRYVGQGKSNYSNGWFLWKGENAEYLTDPVYSFEHAKYGIETTTLKSMVSKYNISKGNLHSVANGKRHSTKGWTLVGNQKVLDVIRPPGNSRKVYKTINGEVVATYPSISHAARENGCGEGVVANRCNNIVKSLYCGASFTWKQ